MVIFVLLLISTGFMYYYFQKCRMLEHELATWRTGAKSTAGVVAEEDRPKTVGEYARRMGQRVMGLSSGTGGEESPEAADSESPQAGPDPVTGLEVGRAASTAVSRAPSENESSRGLAPVADTAAAVVRQVASDLRPEIIPERLMEDILPAPEPSPTPAPAQPSDARQSGPPRVIVRTPATELSSIPETAPAEPAPTPREIRERRQTPASQRSDSVSRNVAGRQRATPRATSRPAAVGAPHASRTPAAEKKSDKIESMYDLR